MSEQDKTSSRQQRFLEQYPEAARQLSGPEAAAGLQQVAQKIERITEPTQYSCSSDYDAFNLLITV